MNRRSFLARILMIDGILLLLVATLYFVLTNIAIKWLAFRLTPTEYTEVAPQFLLNHIAVGILLVPLALTTFYCAWGIRKGAVVTSREFDEWNQHSHPPIGALLVHGSTVLQLHHVSPRHAAHCGHRHHDAGVDRVVSQGHC